MFSRSPSIADGLPNLVRKKTASGAQMRFDDETIQVPLVSIGRCDQVTVRQGEGVQATLRRSRDRCIRIVVR